ncbi:MCE family protein [Pseudonocardia sp. NPDC049154]|uniref:MCE family protein n=1 Tax=Pseudonocardia sp. NPDC049154 TaxID=3155501 RepID=UPI00340537F0
MIRFRDKNPVVVGAVGLAAILVVLGLALNSTALLNIGGTGHSALFSEAGGLKEGDPVKVGGFDIGRVTAVELDGPDVRVDFRVTDPEVVLGSQTSAAVSVATVLGDKFLKLTPAGDGELDGADPIPRTRTAAPYDLPDALSTLTTKSEDIDVDRLSTALDTVSETLDGKGPQLRTAVDGVGRLSQTIASRDAQLRELLGHAQQVTGVLAERSDQVKLLITDGNLLLGELQQRQRDISALLANASALAAELNGLVADNREQIGPALDRLNEALEILQQNEDNIAKILKGAVGYATGVGEAVGNGPFFNAYVQNLIPGNLIPLSDYLPKLDAQPQGGGR